MATQIRNILRFTDLEVGTPVSLPHELNIDDVAIVPDVLALDDGPFVVSGDDTEVTITRPNADSPDSVDVLCWYWHSIEREFGPSNPSPNAPGTPAGQGNLIPNPFIIRPNGAGAPSLDELVKVSGADILSAFLSDKLVAGSGIALAILNPGGDEDLEISVSGANAGNIDTGVPITVRGPTNAEGVSSDLARADHDHRLEYEIEDEGVLVSARPRMDFVGVGVTAVDDAGNDKTIVTIPGDSDGGAVVKRSLYEENTVQTSSNTFVDTMGGGTIIVPIDGDYWAIFEGEAENQAASGTIEIGVSVNSVVAVVATSERESQGPAADVRPVLTTVQLGTLTAGDLVRALFRKKSGAGTVGLRRRHLSIFKVQ